MDLANKDGIIFQLPEPAIPKRQHPESYKSGKLFSISVFYMVSKEGKISEVKLFRIPEDQDDLFEFVRAKLLACPYKWSPAYQNGRPVKGFLKMRIIGDGNNTQREALR